jgi:elongation factor Ts
MSAGTVSADMVKQLRERTGAGVMECKKALEEAGGDVDRAVAILHERGIAQMEKRQHRETMQGVVECYVHAGGRIGAMVEVNCETDFVARTEDFKLLAREIAMQVAAMSPAVISEEDLPSGAEGDPDHLVLLRQAYIRDPGRTIADLVRDVSAKTRENIRIGRFARFELGQ